MRRPFSPGWSPASPSSDNLHGRVEARQRRCSKPISVDVQRSKLPKPQLVRGPSLDLIRYAEERSSRNSESFR